MNNKTLQMGAKTPTFPRTVFFPLPSATCEGSTGANWKLTPGISRSGLVRSLGE